MKHLVANAPAGLGVPVLTATAAEFRPSLHEQVVHYVRSVQERAAIKAQFVWCLIDHVHVVAQCVLSGCSLAVFGSYATGLCLDSSDVDLQLSHPRCTSRKAVQRACFDLHKQLAELPWVTSSKCIATAAIPVVKVQASLAVLTGCSFAGSVDVDISIDDSCGSHLGQSSLELTQQLLAQYPALPSVAIVLKTLLTSHDLNSSYRGGLSSYSLLLWIVAVLNETHCGAEDTGALLMRVLEFYGTQFTPETTGIDISQGRGFFECPTETGVYTVDPVKTSNNATKSSYKVAEVLQVFRQAYHSLLSTQRLLSSIIRLN